MIIYMYNNQENTQYYIGDNIKIIKTIRKQATHYNIGPIAIIKFSILFILCS